MLKKLFTFLTHTVWTLEVARLSKIQAFFLRLLRLILLTLKSFTKKEIQEKAAVLTYYTVLAMIPLLAIMLAISKGLLLEGIFIEWLHHHFNVQQDLIDKLISYAEQALYATRQKAFAGLGIAIFLWSNIKLLSQLEWGMNYIFEAKQTRGFLRRCTDYFALIIFAPLLLILSTGFTIFISAKLNTPGANHSYIFINLITYLLISFLFTFLYIFFPNAKIKVSSALIGGFVAALIYQLLQFAYLHVQFLLSNMGNVAATLGGISLFLIWVQLSWVIFLLGAKLTYSMQNIDAYEFIVEEFPLSEYTKEILSLMITHHCIYEFCKNNPPPTVFEISTRLSIPLRITRELLDNLLYAEVLVEAKTQLQEENGYHPAHDVSQLTIKKVLDMINKRGETIPLPEKKEVESILGSLKVFEKLIEESKANILLKDIEVK